jgi:membrane fusion protein, multidrug efflux system
MKLRLVILAGCILICLALANCNKNESAENEESAVATAEVEVAKVEQGEIRRMISVSGTLQALPNQDVKVSPLVAGRVAQVLAIEGNSVSTGEVIARLDASLFQDQLNQAKATLENARLNEERVDRLYERGIAAGKEKEDAHKDYLIAQSAFSAAQIQLSRTQVHSPISGVVVQRFVSAGEQVDGTSGQPILEVANFDPIELVSPLQTNYLSLVHGGQDAELRTDAYADVVFPGKVTAVLPAVTENTNAVTVWIRFENPKGQLRKGMFAQAQIVTSVQNDALYVPAAAVVTSNNEPKVFVVGSDFKVQERRVDLKWRDGDRVEIGEGVKLGELVVTTGSYGLGDGMKVIVSKK